MDAPAVSIILTSYNHSKHLNAAIESVLSQTFEDFEVFIIDDYSTDGSREIIKSYALKDERILPVFHDWNWGKSGCIDLIDKMRGKYIAIMHSDDAWKQDKLEKQVSLLDSRDELAGCFTGVEIINDNGSIDSIHPYNEHFKSYDYDRFQWLNYIFITSRNPFCHPSVLLRKEAFRRIYSKNKALNAIPDLMRWVELLKHGEVAVLPEKLTLFRVHNDNSNTSGMNLGSERRAYTELFFLYDEFLDLNNHIVLEKIFPEAKAYLRDGKGSARFALAMMAIRPEATHQSKLFGLKLLYEMLNNPADAEKLESLYGFTETDFNKLKMENETFSIPMTDYASLYYAPTTDDFDESNKKYMYFVQGNDRNTVVEVGFDLSDIPPDEKRFLRFDPGEGKVIECRIDDIFADGSSDAISIVAHNSYMRSQDGFDVFLTRDPMYLIDGSSKPIDHLTIRFSSEELPLDYLEGLFAEKDTLLAEKDVLLGEKDAEIAELSSTIFNRLHRRLRRQ